MALSVHSDHSNFYPVLFFRVIYEAVSTTFGGNIPAVPQWSSPSRAIVQEDFFLCASIATSMFSIFLAILAEFVPYSPINARGSTSGHGQNQRQKFKARLFRHVVGLALSTEFWASVLLCCGLYRFFSEFTTTYASILLGGTCFATGFYLLTAVVAAIYPDFPPQTTESRIIRWAALAISSAFRRALKYLKTTRRFF